MSNAFDRNKTVEAKLGQIITEPGAQNQRDAVHIAVVPVRATYGIDPGQRIGVTPDGLEADADCDASQYVGIADPFLGSRIKRGQTFWLFLFQGSVHTLRHEWTHPAFPAVAVTAEGAQAVASAKDISEKWLRDWCSANDCPGYDAVLERVQAGDYHSSWSDEYFHFDGSDAHAEIPAEFWQHMAIVTGQKFDAPPTSFSCSC